MWGGVFIAGCSTNIANFSIASTMTTPPNIQKGRYYVEGEHCVFYLLGIPTSGLENRVTLAVANAIENASKKYNIQADAIANLTIEAKAWTAILFAQHCIVAKGQPVIFKNIKKKIVEYEDDE